MKITENKTYVSSSDEKLIERGLADLTVYSLNFDRFFTEEEKEENSRQAKGLDRDQWSQRCDEFSERIHEQLFPIIDFLSKKYNVHQYKENTSMEHYKSNWDLFFYSNRGWNGKDYYDHFKLSFNTNRTILENTKLANEIVELLKSIDVKNVSCSIQYSAEKHKKEIHEIATRLCEEFVGKFIEYLGMTGKIKVVNEFEGGKYYGFFEKGKRVRYYAIDENALVLQYA